MFAHMVIWFGICSLACWSLLQHQTYLQMHTWAYSATDWDGRKPTKF